MEEKATKRDRTPWVSAGVCLTLTVCYLFKPDFLAALTIWPFWVPATLGFLPLTFRLKKDRLRLRRGVLAIWIIAWVAIGDEPAALGRMLFVRGQPHTLRVVSLNCAGGSIDAARESLAYQPDVVLLQETPSRKELETLAAELGLGWHLVVGPDASVLAHGRLRPVELPRGTGDFIAVWAEIPTALEPVLIVSLRLQPPVFRLDYWSPDCWITLARNKSDRRKELAEIANWVASTAGASPVVLGGDFNTPPDHTVTRSLDGVCTDSFRRAGVAWGGTAVNEFPMVRIDQVWTSSDFIPVKVVSMATKHSDHRMVVADFQVASRDQDKIDVDPR